MKNGEQKMCVLGNRTLISYILKQEYPKFKFYYRWKDCKGTFDCALIIFGYWFGVFIVHDIFLRGEN